MSAELGASVCPVLREWVAKEEILRNASKGKLTVAKGKLSRQHCVDNADLLIPLIKEYGMRPSIHMIVDVVTRFLHYARPRGQPLPTSGTVKMESWILKRLVSILNRAAKRPHVPRNGGMRELLKGCGIELSASSSFEDAATEDGGDDEDVGTDYDDNDRVATDVGIGFYDPDEDECMESENDFEDDPEVMISSAPVPKPEAAPKPSSAPKESPASCCSSPVLHTPSPLPRPTCAPASTEKVPKGHGKLCGDHVLQKCGFICMVCRNSHLFREKLENIPCTPGHEHKIQQAAMMCQNCDQLGQCSADFTKEMCPGSEACRAKQLQLQIETAKIHAEKLKVLKTLQEERARMAELLFQKRGFGAMSGSSQMDAVETQPMDNTESSLMVTIHAKVSPAEKTMCSSPPPSDVGPGKEYRKVSAGEATTKDSENEKVGEKVEDSLESKEVTSPPASVDRALPVEEERSQSEEKKDAVEKETDVPQHETPEPKEDPPTPPAVLETPSMSPEEQQNVAKTSGGPKRGRPKTKGKAPKAKARPKAKAKADCKKSTSTPKAKAKAKPKAKAKGKAQTKGKNNKDMEEVEEKKDPKSSKVKRSKTAKSIEDVQDDQDDDGGKGQEVPSSSNDSKKRPREKPSTKTEDKKADSKTETKATKKTKGKKEKKTAKAKKSSKKSGKEPEENVEGKEATTETKPAEEGVKPPGKKKYVYEKSAEKKAELSRKSCAYKAARNKARAEGLSEAECTKLAKKAYAEAS